MKTIVSVLVLAASGTLAADRPADAFSVTMLRKDGTPEDPRIRGEFDDPWANDQDYGLYFALRDCFEGKKND